MAALPDGIRIYAIGDVHGRADLVDRLLARIEAERVEAAPPRTLHLLLGDYIDRGPSSRAVIDRLIQRQRTHEVVCLKGNHERYAFEFLSTPAALDPWRRLGGLETLISYGLTPTMRPDPAAQARLSAEFNRALPDSHRQFLANLLLSFDCGDYLFVHAGIRPGLPLEQQLEEDLLSIRDEFLSSEEDFGKVVVHGHTPVMEPEVRPNRINIDTGAYATGRLTCLKLERDTRVFI